MGLSSRVHGSWATSVCLASSDCGVFVLILCPTMAKQIVKDNIVVSDLDPCPSVALGIGVAENRVALFAFPNRA